MKFITSSLAVFALPLAALAAPVVGDDAAVVSKANSITERSLEKRDGLECVPATEFGKWRANLVQRIDKYCDNHQGWEVKEGYNFVETQNDGTISDILIGVKGLNGCTWTIGVDCYYQLRKPLDQCGTATEDNKHGGTFTDQCAQWVMSIG